MSKSINGTTRRRTYARTYRPGLAVESLEDRTAPAAGIADDYPYPSANPNNADPWLFYYRECTSFVSWRMNRDAGTTSSPYYFTNHMQGGHWGNAAHWDDNAASLGITVDHAPS